MTEDRRQISLAKAILWEEAKGKLRALVAAEGQSMEHRKDENDEYPFEPIQHAVEAFIQDFEGNGHHE